MPIEATSRRHVNVCVTDVNDTFAAGRERQGKEAKGGTTVRAIGRSGSCVSSPVAAGTEVCVW